MPCCAGSLRWRPAATCDDREADDADRPMKWMLRAGLPAAEEAQVPGESRPQSPATWPRRSASGWGPSTNTTPAYVELLEGIVRMARQRQRGGGGMSTRRAPPRGRCCTIVGTRRRHSPVPNRNAAYSRPFVIQKIAQKKCQWRPIPRFRRRAARSRTRTRSPRLRPSTVDRGASSFGVSASHSLPGLQSSRSKASGARSGSRARSCTMNPTNSRFT